MTKLSSNKTSMSPFIGKIEIGLVICMTLLVVSCKQPTVGPTNTEQQKNKDPKSSIEKVPELAKVFPEDIYEEEIESAPVLKAVEKTRWHKPMEERPPATGAAVAVVKLLDSIGSGMTDTRYQGRTSVNHKKGTYYWDCSGMAGWILKRTAPVARKKLGKKRPLARDFYDIIAKSSTKKSRRGWRRLANPEQVGPGDIFAWRKPKIFRKRKNTGHIGFVISTTQPHPDHKNVWVMGIADSTRILHGNDSRPQGGDGGFGTGTIAFLVDDKGTPIAYGWYGAGQDPATFIHTKIAFGRVVK